MSATQPAVTPPPRWRCPDCGRGFTRVRQSHSCRSVALDEHLRDEGARALFERLLTIVRADVGACEVVSLPCCIHLAATYDFLAVLPRRDRLEVRFVLPRRLDDPRITHWSQTGAHAYKHAVDVTDPDDLDPTLLGWIREAYQLPNA
jgi:hypothetical protein